MLLHHPRGSEGEVFLTKKWQCPQDREDGAEQFDVPYQLRRKKDAEHNAVDVRHRTEYHAGPSSVIAPENCCVYHYRPVTGQLRSIRGVRLYS